MSYGSYYQQVYTEGYEAFFDCRLDCPYDPTSRMAKEWTRGFNEAFFEQQKVRYA